MTRRHFTDVKGAKVWHEVIIIVAIPNFSFGSSINLFFLLFLFIFFPLSLFFIPLVFLSFLIRFLLFSFFLKHYDSSFISIFSVFCLIFFHFLSNSLIAFFFSTASIFFSIASFYPQPLLPQNLLFLPCIPNTADIITSHVYFPPTSFSTPTEINRIWLLPSNKETQPDVLKIIMLTSAFRGNYGI